MLFRGVVPGQSAGYICPEPVTRTVSPPRALHHDGAAEKTSRQAKPMRRIAKYLFRLILLLAIGFAAYAIFADLPAPTGDRVITLPLPQADR